MKTVAFFSGGKNSAAMVHRMDTLGQLPDVIMFADTGLEFPETYEFIEQFERKTGIEITWEKRPGKSFLDWFYKPYTKGKKEGQIHGFPMTHNPCYWQRETKGWIMDRYQNEYDLVYVGFAADEKSRNMGKPNHRYPLQDWGWNEKTTLTYCRLHDIVNPMYDWGFPRLGCWLCPYQSKKSIRILYRYLERKSPESWEYLKKWRKTPPGGLR